MRYDKNVPAGAKLLYGEISTLCNKEGYCWAGNAYFAELYRTSERTVINWINALSKGGHISVGFTCVPGKKEVQSRILRLTGAVLSKIDSQNEKEPEPTNQILDEVVKNSSPRGEKIFTTYGKNFQEVVKKSSKGGEKNFMDNTTCNKKTTTTDPPEVEAAGISPEELKKALSALDRRLFFDVSFYPAAAAFMAEKELGAEYISWLRDYCENSDYRSFKGYYYTLFCKDNIAEEYKASLLPDPKPEPQPPPVVCPACGTSYGRYSGPCPSCGLRENPAPEEILLFRELHELPPDKRGEYLRREDGIYHEYNMDSANRLTSLNALKREFGLSVTA